MSTVQVTVVFINGKECYIHLLKDTSILTQFENYRELAGYVFLYDGTKITPEHTPNQLKMKRGDPIDALVPITKSLPPLPR